MHIENALVSVGDAMTVVPKADLPWIVEWEWELDPVTGLVYRLQQGRHIMLYHEILKKHRRNAFFWALDDVTLQRLFGGMPEYEALPRIWEDRENLTKNLGLVLPRPLDVLGYSLTSALYIYLDWFSDGMTYSYTADPEAITPGNLFGRRRHRTSTFGPLENFMREYTGEWVPDEDAPCGIRPQHFSDAIAQGVAGTLNSLLLHMNGGLSPDQFEELWLEYAEAGEPLDIIVLTVLSMIARYPTPEEPDEWRSRM